MHRCTLNLAEPLAAVARPAPVASASAPIASVPAAAPPPPDFSGALRDVVAALGAVVAELHQQRHRHVADTAATSVELGIAVAERLLGAGIAADRQRLDTIVRTSLERLPAARAVLVRAHPDDVALLERQAAAADLHARLTLRPDATMARGSMKLEADEWFVAWDTQRCLNDLRDALLEETFLES